MAVAAAEVIEVLQAFLARIKHDQEVTPESALYADGIGLDSLETAELSATLEDKFGTDPFAQGDLPQTVGDLLAFYEQA
jgi:acyl carrier protein